MFIKVKTAEGRKAFTKPVGGSEIPADRFVPVLVSGWITDLARTGDVILQPQEEAAAEAAAPAPTAKTTPRASKVAADKE